MPPTPIWVRPLLGRSTLLPSQLPPTNLIRLVLQSSNNRSFTSLPQSKVIIQRNTIRNASTTRLGATSNFSGLTETTNLFKSRVSQYPPLSFLVLDYNKHHESSWDQANPIREGRSLVSLTDRSGCFSFTTTTSHLSYSHTVFADSPIINPLQMLSSSLVPNPLFPPFISYETEFDSSPLQPLRSLPTQPPHIIHLPPPNLLQ